ncbi:alpha/beta hydrolase [Flexithrix dorotheae]|uniref:alpha/beta hydrolase n=1 Tax=Flexithrix dorotheae TaxID=70993 RepID=UPI00038146C6|nr:alpha/beta hydrolase [Flexithrix dorotheae]
MAQKFDRFHNNNRKILFDRDSWGIASIVIIICTLVISALGISYLNTGLGNFIESASGILFGIICLVSFSIVSYILLRLSNTFPQFFIIALGGSIGTILALSLLGFHQKYFWFFPFLAFFAWVQSLFAGCIWVVLTGRHKLVKGLQKFLLVFNLFFTFLFNIFCIYFLTQDSISFFAQQPVEPLKPISTNFDLQNPLEKGLYKVNGFYYGSDLNDDRPQYGLDNLKLVTDAVDASLVYPQWSRLRRKIIDWQWNLDVKKMPVNGMVWMPEGLSTAAPLVVIVHGNNQMEKASESGFSYLGELLATKGYIVVAIDLNFLNDTWRGNYRGVALKTKSWFILQHLKVFRKWNNIPGNVFFQKVDLENIALIGHREGAHAIVKAFEFNKLPYFPENADLKFDFNFNIKSLISLAPVYHESYEIAHLKNVNYLTCLGSFDNNDLSFSGIEQFHKISSLDTLDYLKSIIQIHGANGDQFNKNWDYATSLPPEKWILNKNGLLSSDEQLRVSELFVTTFLGATLLKDGKYLPYFYDQKVGLKWLPETAYFKKFIKSDFFKLIDFEEDQDLTSTTIPDGKIIAENIKLWKETKVHVSKHKKVDNHVVYLGWNNSSWLHLGKSVVEDSLAYYQIEVPKNILANAHLNGNSAISMSLAQLKPTALRAGKESQDNSPLNFTIELEDSIGIKTRFTLRQLGYLYPSFIVPKLKIESLLGINLKEREIPVLQTFHLPINRIRRLNPEFDIRILKKIRLVFDKSEIGLIVLDDLGLSSVEMEEPEI